MGAHGTWKQTGSSSDLGGILAAAGVVLLAAAVLPAALDAAGFALAMLAKLVVYTLLGMAALTIAATFAYRTYRAHHPQPLPPWQDPGHRLYQARQAQVPPPASKPPMTALPPARHAGVTINILGGDPETIAAAIRQAQEGRP